MQVKFTKSGANEIVGGFSPGDVARVSDAMGKHLVEDAKVAVYVEAPKQVKEDAPAVLSLKKKDKNK